MRIAIAGPPKSGKTTLANSLGVYVRHTDDMLHLGWSAASDAVSRWFDGDAFVIEGVAVLRALRKWRERHPSSPPPLDLLVMCEQRVPYTKRGQQSMATQIAGEYAELARWLEPVHGGEKDLRQAIGAKGAGYPPPVPISCAKKPKSAPGKGKPAPKLALVAKRDTRRVRGERKFSIATPPATAPEPEARAGDIAPIVTTSYLQAFEQLGGVKGLVRWGRHNPSAFYRTLAALAPALGRHAKGHGLVVQVAQFSDKQGRVIDGTALQAADDPDPE